MRQFTEGASARADEALSKGSDILEKSKVWLAVLLPMYLAIRILAVSRFDLTIASEVVRQQGVSGVAEAALTVLFREALGLVVIGGLLIALRTGSKRIRVVALLLSVVASVFVPWTLLVLVLAILLLLLLINDPNGAGRRRAVQLLGLGALAVFVALAILVPLVSAPWLPYERVWSTSWPPTASGSLSSKKTTEPTQATEQVSVSEIGHNGYVLGHESGDYYSVMYGKAHLTVALVPNVTRRLICQPKTSLWRLEAPSLASLALTHLFDSGAVVPPCSDAEDVEFKPPPVPDPTRGLPGRDGKDGKDGRDGQDGVDGKDGGDGQDGTDGKGGARGPRGLEGKKGDPGETVYIHCPTSTTPSRGC